jgi:hypothetical protein
MGFNWLTTGRPSRKMMRDSLVEPLVAPIGAHFGMDHILVDCCQLVGEQLVERLDNLFVSLHCNLLIRPLDAGASRCAG